MVNYSDNEEPNITQHKVSIDKQRTTVIHWMEVLLSNGLRV